MAASGSRDGPPAGDSTLSRSLTGDCPQRVYGPYRPPPGEPPELRRSPMYTK